MDMENRMRVIRLGYGFSVREFGIRLGYSKRYIYAVESGRDGITRSVNARLDSFVREME